MQPPENPYQPPSLEEEPSGGPPDEQTVLLRSLAPAFAWIVIFATAAYVFHSLADRLGTPLRVLGIFLFIAFSVFVVTKVLQSFAKL